MTQKRQPVRKLYSLTPNLKIRYKLWPGPAEGYAKNQVHLLLWRMHGREQFEDLMQEAWLVYLKVQESYAQEVDSPKWLMSLFREALQNRLTDLARRNKRRFTSEVMGESDVMENTEDEQLFSIDPIVQLIEALDKAPDEFRAALLVLVKAPDELLEEIQKMARRSLSRASRFLCRLTGQPEDKELLVKARDYIKENIS